MGDEGGMIPLGGVNVPRKISDVRGMAMCSGNMDCAPGIRRCG